MSCVYMMFNVHPRLPRRARLLAVHQILRRSSGIHRVFLGGAPTEHKIHTDPSFLPSLSKVDKHGIRTSSMLFAGGAYGAEPGRPVQALQSYQTKISLYGQRKPSTRVSEVGKGGRGGGGVRSGVWYVCV